MPSLKLVVEKKKAKLYETHLFLLSSDQMAFIQHDKVKKKTLFYKLEIYFSHAQIFAPLLKKVFSNSIEEK